MKLNKKELCWSWFLKGVKRASEDINTARKGSLRDVFEALFIEVEKLVEIFELEQIEEI